MLIQTRNNKRRTQPQLLAIGSVSLQDGRRRDQKQRPSMIPTKADQQVKTIAESVEPSKPQSKCTPVAPVEVKPVDAPVLAILKPEVLSNPSKETKIEQPTATTTAKSPKRRHVRFHSVELKEYSVTIGDHPWCKGYFPLTLDWSHTQPVEFRINDYERQRMRNRSELEELHMSVQERWERLRLVTGLAESTLASLERRRHRQQ